MKSLARLIVFLCVATYIVSLSAGMGFCSKSNKIKTIVCYNQVQVDASCSIEKSNIISDTIMDQDELIKDLSNGSKFGLDANQYGNFNFKHKWIEKTETKWNEVSFYYLHRLSKKINYSIQGVNDDALTGKLIKVFNKELAVPGKLSGEEAEKKYQSKINDALKNCGDHLITAIEADASLMVKFTIRFDESTIDNGLKLDFDLALKNAKGGLGLMLDLEKRSKNHKVKGSINIEAEQIGGSNSTQLATAFTGFANATSCSIDNTETCQALLGSIIKYATESFPEQTDCKNLNSFNFNAYTRIKTIPLEEVLYNYEAQIKKYRE